MAVTEKQKQAYLCQERPKPNDWMGCVDIDRQARYECIPTVFSRIVIATLSDGCRCCPSER